MNYPVPGQFVWNLEAIVPKDPNNQYATSFQNWSILFIYPYSMPEKVIYIYDFNISTGELKISMPKSDLELMIAEIGAIPLGGEDIQLCSPPTMSSDYPYLKFKNVKSLVSMDSVNGQYALHYTPLSKNSKETKTLHYLGNSYIKREHKN